MRRRMAIMGAATVGAVVAATFAITTATAPTAAAAELTPFQDCSQLRDWYVEAALPSVTAWGWGGGVRIYAAEAAGGRQRPGRQGRPVQQRHRHERAGGRCRRARLREDQRQAPGPHRRVQPPGRHRRQRQQPPRARPGRLPRRHVRRRDAAGRRPGDRERRHQRIGPVRRPDGRPDPQGHDGHPRAVPLPGGRVPDPHHLHQRSEAPDCRLGPSHRRIDPDHAPVRRQRPGRPDQLLPGPRLHLPEQEGHREAGAGAQPAGGPRLDDLRLAARPSSSRRRTRARPWSPAPTSRTRRSSPASGRSPSPPSPPPTSTTCAASRSPPEASWSTPRPTASTWPPPRGAGRCRWASPCPTWVSPRLRTQPRAARTAPRATP